MTGEGVPDLLYMIMRLTTTVMAPKITYRSELQCTVLEVPPGAALSTDRGGAAVHPHDQELLTAPAPRTRAGRARSAL